MNRPLWLGSAFLLCTLTHTPAAKASPTANSKILVHLAPTGGNGCTLAASPPACGAITTSGSLLPNAYYAYVLVTDGDAGAGIAGLQFGLDYNGTPGAGIDVYDWRLCATLQFPMPGWPAAGTGNLITWDPGTRCQRSEPGGPGTGVTAVAGYLYVAAYSADALRITPRPADGLARVAGCDGSETTIASTSTLPNPSPLGYAAFSAAGATPGYSPCGTATSPPGCTISGPVNALQNSGPYQYAVTSSSPGATFQWSISGNGSLSGGSSGPTVSVQAGAPGAFTLSVHVTPSTGSDCSYTVNVITQLDCMVGGPTPVLEGTTSTYTASSNVAGVSFAWSISGSGTIVGTASGPTVKVTAGPAGSFTLTAAMTGTPITCSKDVIVTQTPPAPPGANNNAKILVHLGSPATKNPCASTSAHPRCNQIVTHGSLYPSLYFAYVLVADGYTTGALRSGIAGVQLGITYNQTPRAGVDIYAWSLCANVESPSPGWPASGQGNLITWDSVNNCQRLEPGGQGTGVVATAGYFYAAAYTSDYLSITPRPVDGLAKVTDCLGVQSILEGNGVVHQPSSLGRAGFGSDFGYNPCGLSVPVHETTWSGIKALFKGN